MRFKALLAILLIFSVAAVLAAFISDNKPQAGHQSMIITATKQGKEILVAVSENGAAYRDHTMKTDKSDGDLGPLIMFVDQQYAKGWKLHSSTMDAGYYYFLLEK